jgi:hypothetical protein
MIQAVDSEQVFVTNLEQFMTKADKFIKTYYSGIGEVWQVREIMQELRNMLKDADLEQLEIDYQQHCEIKDLMADCDDSAWF